MKTAPIAPGGMLPRAFCCVHASAVAQARFVDADEASAGHSFHCVDRKSPRPGARGRRTDLRLYEVRTDSIPLSPDCYLQWLEQPSRVTRTGPQLRCVARLAIFGQCSRER